MKRFKFSLIIATLERVDTIPLLLDSMLQQRYSNFEVIIADQNNDDRIDEICKRYSKQINVKIVKVQRIGLSTARNIGLAHATGEIVSFPDDDCIYDKHTLEEVCIFFNKKPDFDILSISTVDPLTNQQLSYTPLKYETIIDISNIFYSVTSIGIFVKDKWKNVFFDEKLGVGGEFNSSEEMDYIVCILKNGVKAFYDPSIKVYHPKLMVDYSEKFYDKIKKNSVGHGAFSKKHFNAKSFQYLNHLFFQLIIIRPLGGLFLSLISMNIKEVKKYYLMFVSRIKGFVLYAK